MHYFTLLTAIEYAKNHNGLFPVRIEHSANEKDAIETLESLFRFDLNAIFLIAPIAFSKAQGMTKLKREYLKKYISHTDKEFHHIDIFEVFNLDSEKRDMQELIVFEDFFNMVKKQCLSHGLKYNLKMMYEPGPVRLVPYAGKSESQKFNKLEDETNEVVQYLEKHKVINDYFCFVAKYLRNTGRWSWVNIYHSMLLTPGEERPLFLKETD